jgi:hypothetical protein
MKAFLLLIWSFYTLKITIDLKLAGERCKGSVRQEISGEIARELGWTRWGEADCCR